LKLLIQNEFNKILSTNEDVRKLLQFKYPKDISIDRKIIHTTSLFSLILKEIKGSSYFEEWYKSCDEGLHEIYDNIVEELLIKVITLQPYSNIKDIKEKSFFWIIYKLDTTIDDFIKSKKNSFRKFRYIKFLLRRATLLGSNYIIRKKALEKFKEIYSLYSSKDKDEKYRRIKAKCYNREFKIITSQIDLISLEKAEIESSLKSNTLLLNKRYSDINIEIIELNHKRDFIIQAIRNLQYIEV
jgi:hypothetical protein